MAELNDCVQDGDVEVDPAAAFLAREQSDLAGLELELEDEEPKFIPESAGNSVIAGGTIAYNGGGVSPTLVTTGGGSSDNGGSEGSVAMEEQENIRKWREEQIKRLEIKDMEEEVKKLEWREMARKELEDWYSNHKDVIAKTKAQNRNAEKQFVAEDSEITPGFEWERIARLCDFNPKVKGVSGGAGVGAGGSGGHSSSHSPRDRDVSRMRTIILQRKQAQQQAQTTVA